MGKYIAGMTVLGGVLVIKSLMTPQVNGTTMFIGFAVLVAAMILFIRELTRISKKNK